MANLLRHGERPQIPKGSFGNDLALTEKGKRDCQSFANKITGKVHAIMTSPVLRCMQTAQIIAKTCSLKTGSITTSSLLGDPGCFIHDPKAAGRLWLENKNTPDRVKEILLTNSFPPDGFNDFAQTSIMLLKLMVAQMNKYNEGTILWVTHDAILAPFASRTLTGRLAVAQWPEYLGYLEISLRNSASVTFSYCQNGQSETFE